GLPPVMGNFQQLEQVVINLITNSCQALSSPDEEVELSTFYEEGRVKLRVRDQGSGITGESMKHIFDPFYTTKRETGGTGLGLSISYNILKNHGGELIFDSEPGRGTSAIISLPPFRLEKKDPEEENQ
ncbi:MAG TPA: HAMP domain-containing sensor histidine kinase, partial [Candidatus Aminicenantes bacterium]|nr:HAMP domain-containing sensor histidine kinase [Candidatus Aminicenantes bacterium]